MTTDPQASTTPIDDLATWVTAYQQACTNRNQWADIADRAKQQITQLLAQASAEFGTIGGRPVVRWEPVTTRKIDVKTLRAKDPDLAERYTYTTTTRRFTILDPDEGA